jgi:hypothetical protein
VRGDGGHGLLTLVRAVTGRARFKAWVSDAAEIKKMRVWTLWHRYHRRCPVQLDCARPLRNTTTGPVTVTRVPTAPDVYSNPVIRGRKTLQRPVPLEIAR